MRQCFLMTILAALVLVASGCGKEAVDGDTAPFEAAIGQYLKANAMGMKVHRFKTLTIDANEAQARVSLGHADGATAVKVQWSFTFQKQGAAWKVTSYRK